MQAITLFIDVRRLYRNFFHTFAVLNNTTRVATASTNVIYFRSISEMNIAIYMISVYLYLKKSLIIFSHTVLQNTNNNTNKCPL